MLSVIAAAEIDFFFFNDTATTEIYTLSLHDALPISTGKHKADADGGGCVLARLSKVLWIVVLACAFMGFGTEEAQAKDRKSTRLNSSHANISYAVFCLKKKKITFSTYYTYLQLTQRT